MMTRDDPVMPERHPFARPAFLLSAIALVALVVGVVWVVVAGPGPADTGASNAGMSDNASNADNAGNAGNASNAGGSGESGGAGVCAPTGGLDDGRLTAAPLGRVETIDTVPTFVSPAGPRVREGVPGCYAPSEEGAVVAAANALNWIARGPSVAEVIRTRAVDDANAREALALTPDSQAGTEPEGIRVHGFWSEQWSEEVVLVVLVVDSASSAGAWLTWPMKMEYTDGDWKFTWPEGNNWGASRLDSAGLPAGFIEWSW